MCCNIARVLQNYTLACICCGFQHVTELETFLNGVQLISCYGYTELGANYAKYLEFIAFKINGNLRQGVDGESGPDFKILCTKIA